MTCYSLRLEKAEQKPCHLRCFGVTPHRDVPNGAPDSHGIEPNSLQSAETVLRPQNVLCGENPNHPPVIFRRKNLQNYASLGLHPLRRLSIFQEDQQRKFNSSVIKSVCVPGASCLARRAFKWTVDSSEPSLENIWTRVREMHVCSITQSEELYSDSTQIGLGLTFGPKPVFKTRYLQEKCNKIRYKTRSKITTTVLTVTSCFSHNRSTVDARFPRESAPSLLQ